MSDSERFEVVCECCLLREEWSEFRPARLQYGFHEDHYGSRLTVTTEGGTRVST